MPRAAPLHPADGMHRSGSDSCGRFLRYNQRANARRAFAPFKISSVARPCEHARKGRSKDIEWEPSQCGLPLLTLPRFEIARVLVRFDHVASVIVNANHGGVSPHPTHYSGVG